MKWGDAGGFSRVQHIIVSAICDRGTWVLCGTQFMYGFQVKHRIPLPRCERCKKALARLLRD